MRLPGISAGVTAIVAGIALSSCGGHSVVPSSPTALGPASQTPISSDNVIGDDVSPLTTCAKSPPQYDWIFKGSCVMFTLKPTGASFSLPPYNNYTVKGLIGKNTVKTSAKIALADALDKNGDITKWNGKAFPPYHANGTTIIYATAVNQSTQHIKPIPVRNKPVLQYTITYTKNLPGKTCGAAVLAQQKNGQLKWTSLPATGTVKGKTVTISQYEVPAGFELPPKTPLYFAVNCF